MALGMSARRDLSIIIFCSIILLFLIDFRYDLSTRVLVNVDRGSISGPPPVLPPPEDFLDEYGEEIPPPSPPPGLRQHRPGGHGPKHKNIAAKVAAAAAKAAANVKLQASKSRASGTYDTHDRTIDQSRVIWTHRDMPLTSLVRHSPGWTILDNVYFLNGTLYIVRADVRPAPFPGLRMMISNGANMHAETREPTEENMKIISVAEAAALFGTQASRVEGTSLISYDDVELFAHYYHFSAEVLFGLWRTYSSLDLAITPSGYTKLPQPRRFIAPHVPVSRWRDYANLNQYVLRAAFPSTGIEFQSDWADRAETMRPYLFDRIVLGDRLAAGRGIDPKRIEKMAFHADKMPKSPHWWEPVRKNVVEFSGGEAARKNSPPVITYVTRQAWGKRILRDEDHKRLVNGLRGLQRQFGWEVNVVNMEDLTRDEQIRLAGRTTILMGVHGAGLTSLVWMTPAERTTVIEFLAPDSFSEDFEYTARMLNIKHYSFWNDKSMTYPELPSRSDLPERDLSANFESDDIPLDADKVVALCIERLQFP